MKRCWVIQAEKEGRWIQIGVSRTRAGARTIRSSIMSIGLLMNSLLLSARPRRTRVARGDRKAAELLDYLDKKFPNVPKMLRKSSS